jgi:signal peptidase II
MVGGLAAAVLALDQLTKQIVDAALSRGEAVDLFFGIEITNVRNDGVAFGLLAGGDVPVIAFTVCALAVLLAYFAMDPARPGGWIAVGLICGGALGNLVDRLTIGSVIDFIDPPLWPAFNLADVAIVLGVAMLVLTVRLPAPGDERSTA